MIECIPGQTMIVTARFYDQNGDLFDPDTVTMYSKDPTGATQTCVYGDDCAVEKISTGVYEGTLQTKVDDVAMEGRYHVRFEGVTGDYTAVARPETTILAVPSEFA